jgi:ribosomal protein S2
MGLNNSIILDINYHKSTLMYLDKLSVFTLGVVPTSYDIKSVDLAIPVNIDNLFTQLFIVRLLVKFIKISENTKYTDYSNLWVKQNN